MNFLQNLLRTHGTTMRIAMGLVSVLVTLLLVAAFFGLLPDKNTEVLKGRVSLAEAIASNTSVFVTRSDVRRMEANLNLMLSRNPEILSASVRKADAKALVTVGEHDQYWLIEGDANSQLAVPIWAGDTQWGQVELRFEPLAGKGILGFILQPISLLIGFMSFCCFFLFFFYLRKMLKHLDPSQAIPDRVRSALDTMAEGLLVLDAKQNIVLANEAFAALVDIPAGSLLGRKASVFPWCDIEDRELAWTEFPWTRTLKEGETQRNKSIRLNIPNDKSRTFQTNCSPVLTANEKVGGVLISFDDITELEEKETQLRQSKLDAEEANRAKSDFLANMSHEIRTPMNAIMGFTEILKRDYGSHGSTPKKAENLQHLNTIANSSQHLLDLINDILDLSKVEAGRVEVEKIPCSVHLTIIDVMLIMRPRAEEKGLSLEFFPEPPMPETILTDPARLRQILLNLVGNAIKFTEEGEVSVVARLGEAAGESAMIIEVKDSGIGMTDSQAEAIFSPFIQADASITRRFGGTGLGLTISKRFAEALGGDVTVSSQENEGSVFTITLPTGELTGATLYTQDELLVPDRKEAAVEEGRWVFEPAQVLVVDDGAENRELLRIMLEDNNLAVHTANDGQQALDQLAQQPFDMVLMDVQMPVMDGFTAVGKMREMGIELPVIALTADAMKGVKERCLSAGYSGYLSKPIVFDDLFARIAEDLDSEFVAVDEFSEPEFESAPASAPAPEIQAFAVPVSELPTEISTAVAVTAVTADIEGEGAPIFSSLPTDSGKFTEIILKFVGRLEHQTRAVESALAQERYDILQDLGHWFKGSPGSVGFHQFDEPGEQLYTMATQHDKAMLSEVASQISALSARVRSAYSDAPAMSETDAPALATTTSIEKAVELSSPLPEAVISDMAKDERFRPLVEKFVMRLPAQLDSLELALETGDTKQVLDIAHWLKGTAGSVGLHDFTAPATELDALVRADQTAEATKVALHIRALNGRIELNPPENNV